jgi:hypothetical protein
MQIHTIISVLLLIPLGLCSKFYTGPASYWVNNSLSGILYVLFWCLIIFLFFKKIQPLTITGFVFSITCILEILQLWRPPLLEMVRQTFIGKTLIGTTFVYSDFIYYLIGCIMAYCIMSRLQKIK